MSGTQLIKNDTVFKTFIIWIKPVDSHLMLLLIFAVLVSWLNCGCNWQVFEEQEYWLILSFSLTSKMPELHSLVSCVNDFFAELDNNFWIVEG